jgi:hypothetical protein
VPLKNACKYYFSLDGMLHTNNRLHGDGKVNTGVTTKLSKIKCNRIVKAYEKNNIYRHSWMIKKFYLF